MKCEAQDDTGSEGRPTGIPPRPGPPSSRYHTQVPPTRVPPGVARWAILLLPSLVLVAFCSSRDHDRCAVLNSHNLEREGGAMKRLIAVKRMGNPGQEYLMATKLFTRSLATIAVAAILLPASITSAGVIPVGLNPGDTYHLVFVTDGTRDAMSINIEDYNDFVQAEAALNPAITGTDIGVQYHAIASTATVDARDNAPVSAPVYRTDGTTLVATGFADMWDRTILESINLNQWSTTYSGHVWTGSYANGYGVNTHPDYVFGGPWVLGHYGGVSTQSRAQLGATNHGELAPWIFREFFTSTITNEYPLYALSDPLVVPVPVPEPSSLVIFATGGIVLAGWSWRRRRCNKEFRPV